MFNDPYDDDDDNYDLWDDSHDLIDNSDVDDFMSFIDPNWDDYNPSLQESING